MAILTAETPLGDVELFTANVTHNLMTMAEAAGLYRWIWYPEQKGVKIASDLIIPLTAGLQRLKADPGTFQKYNPSNGWGSYERFIPWIENYLRACYASPGARVTVSR